jgi:hypothetical protein
MQTLGTVFVVIGLAWCAYFVLPTSVQRRVHEAITSRSPALDLLFPDPNTAD